MRGRKENFVKLFICIFVFAMVVAFSSAQELKPNQSEAKVFITATMHAKAGMRDELRKKLLERAQHGRSEPGCIRFDVLTQTDDPDTFLLNEAWVSDEAVDAHFKSEAHLSWQAEREKYVASRQLVRWHAVADSK